MSRTVVAAIDIGESDGRVIAGIVEGGRIILEPIHHFANPVRLHDGHLRWNVTELFTHVVDGLRMLADEYPAVESIGIDTWGAAYGLLDRKGRLLAEPISYRDQRTAEAVRKVHERLTPDDLFAISGLQFQPANTLYQLFADGRGPHWKATSRIALVPDLVVSWLTGELRAEYTNATTTGLVDSTTRRWSMRLLDRLGLVPSMLPAIDQPGSARGTLLPELVKRTGLPASTSVVAVASHEVASAVVALPSARPNVAFIVGSNTSPCVGIELDSPVVTAAARDANFTNEGGIDGTTRFLRRIDGRSPMRGSMQASTEDGSPYRLETPLDEAAARSADGPLLDLVEYLAAASARAVHDAASITGTPIQSIHMVGDGARNDLLCQRTANAAGLPVIAGPGDAAAIGNVLVQARAIGAVHGTIAELRSIVASSAALIRYEPS